MKNMFSDYHKKKIPNNFNECYESDNLIKNLWGWCDLVENIGKIFAIILGIATFILGIVLIDASDGVSILISLVGTPIVIFLEYGFFHIIALLIGSLASIVQHTKISANIALYEYGKNCESEDNTDVKIADNIINNKDKSKEKIKNTNTIIKNEKLYFKVKCPYCHEVVELNEDVIKPFCPHCKKEFEI